MLNTFRRVHSLIKFVSEVDSELVSGMRIREITSLTTHLNLTNDFYKINNIRPQSLNQFQALPKF